MTVEKEDDTQRSDTDSPETVEERREDPKPPAAPKPSAKVSAPAPTPSLTKPKGLLTWLGEDVPEDEF